MKLKGTQGMLTILLLGVFAIALQGPPAYADADAERQALARIIHEIEILKPLLAEAKAAADPDCRIQFRYDWLKKDLERVRQGIQEHIDAPRAEPRSVTPLRGDYRR